MGYIADLSRYDPIEAVDQYDGVILNVEDPGFAAKRDRAIGRGIPWGVYSWVYPGFGIGAVDKALVGRDSPLGMWLDYEQEGVGPGDLEAALSRADQLGVKVGVYTYLFILDSVAGVIGDRPLWLAYYPGGSDWQPSYSDTARARGAVLHQFTSSGGNRDLSVVLDAARWPITTPGDDDMTKEEFQAYFLDEKPFGVSRIGGAVGDEVAKSVEKYLFEDKPFGVTRFEAYLKEALKAEK